MALTPQWLDELRSRITLSGVIGRSTRIQKAGREFKACCPFHNEKTPSFTINDEKGFYHCFGCGAHGDVIRWMTDQRGLSFMDAVKQLAEEAGMDMPAPDPRAAARAEQAKSLHDVMAATQDWFAANLRGPGGEAARAYLATRGFSPDVCQRFGFGYAPEDRQALKKALSSFPEAMLIEAGLRIAVDDDKGNKREPYDRFRGRLMLPIHDPRGRVIAFGGRILTAAKTDAPKYLNSPDTPLFDKGRTLYNLHRAAPHSRQSGRMLVVEGYMDAIALSAAGFGDCVAPLGTALTETQIEMLWRQVEAPVLCFDGDKAGQRAAMRAMARALPLLRPGHTLRILTLPQGLDPDDLLRQRGPAAMETLLGEAQSLLDTLWTHERDALPLAGPEDKAGLKARLMAHVDTIADADIKALYRRELLDRFSDFAFPPRESRASMGRPAPPRGASGARRGGRFADLPPREPKPETAARLTRPAGDGARARILGAVVAGLLAHPDEIARHAEALAQIAPDDARIDTLLDHLDHGGVLEQSTLCTILAQRGLNAPTAAQLAGFGFGFLMEADDGGEARADLAEIIRLLVERPAVDAALAHSLARLEQDLTPEAFDEHKRLIERERDLHKRELELKARLGQTAITPGNAAGAEAPNKMAE